MRVLTMNIFAHHRSWRDRRSVLVAGLRHIDPDVVVFQEAIATDSYDQVAELLGPDYAWRPRPGRRIDYVMVGCGDHGATLEITRCELAFDRPVDGVCASDHFGVVADLQPAPPRAHPL